MSPEGLNPARQSRLLTGRLSTRRSLKAGWAAEGRCCKSIEMNWTELDGTESPHCHHTLALWLLAVTPGKPETGDRADSLWGLGKPNVREPGNTWTSWETCRCLLLIWRNPWFSEIETLGEFYFMFNEKSWKVHFVNWTAAILVDVSLWYPTTCMNITSASVLGPGVTTKHLIHMCSM